RARPAKARRVRRAQGALLRRPGHASTARSRCESFRLAPVLASDLALVAVLDDRVRRQPAFGLAEVHRPARRDDAQAELACRADLRLEHPLAAWRKEVVVVEDGRAAGERELREPAARRGVLRLLVDTRPDGIERLQPAEEVLVLRAGARQV